MAEQDTTPAERPPDFRVVIEGVAEGAERVGMWGHLWAPFFKALEALLSDVIGYIFKVLAGAAAWLASRLVGAEVRSEAAFGELARVAVEDVFGVQASPAQLTAGAGRDARGQVAGDVGRVIMNALAGGEALAAAGELKPSADAAINYVDTMAKMSMESWLQGLIGELVTLGQVEALGDLDDTFVRTFGLGRISRRILGPVIDVKVVRPFEWYMHKQYRPELLSAAAAVEAFHAGRLTGAQLTEELARQGWSDERINILVANARKRLTFGDLVYQHFRGQMTDADVIRRAGELGYDDLTARELLELEIATRRDRWLGPLVDGAVAAYLDGNLSEAQMRALVEANAPSALEAQIVINTATTRRAWSRRDLSSGRVRQLVIGDVLSVVDFRRALERENWSDHAIAAEELALRMELDEKRNRAKALAEQQRARIEEEELKRRERLEREAELAARRALPALTEMRRAYIRGLITRDALAEAITREKIAISADDLTVLLADADLDRSEYLEQLERRERALERQVDPTLSLAVLEQTVLDGILTLPEFDARLAQRGYDDDERRMLTALLQARLDDRDRAQAARAAAAERAELRAVSLADFERAVRLGLRSRAQYAELLERLDTPPVARALVLDLLDADIAADASARQKRAALESAAEPRGISLATRRRAVLEGVRPRAYYEEALRAASLPPDDQLAELALLDLELAQRQAAQARRDAIAAEHEAARLERERRAADAAAAANEPPPPPSLSIAQLERAVRLGLLPPDALRAELRAKGYGPDDVELMVQLTIAAIPDTRRAEARELEIAAELEGRQVSLGALQEAVLAGIRTPAEFEAQLAGYGYGPDDVVLLRLLLDDRVALERARLDAQLRARLEKIAGAPTLEEVLAAVDAGEIALDELRQVLEAIGVEAPLALLYARIVGAFGIES